MTINEEENPQTKPRRFITATALMRQTQRSDHHRKRSKMDVVKAVKAKSLGGNVLVTTNLKKTRCADKFLVAEDQQPQPFKALQSLHHPPNQSGIEIVGNTIVTWHPSIVTLHLEYRFEFQDSDSRCRFLAFAERTTYLVYPLHTQPKSQNTLLHLSLHAIELVAATRVRVFNAKVGP